MTDDATAAVDAAVEVAQEAGYSLTQLDVDHVFSLFSLVAFVELAQLALLVLLVGLVFGGYVTRKWSV